MLGPLFWLVSTVGGSMLKERQNDDENELKLRKQSPANEGSQESKAAV
jgi:hypothetical protein